MLGMELLIKRRAVLHTSIRVMNQCLMCSTRLQRHAKGLGHRVGMQTAMHVIADYFSRESIRHQTQIDRIITLGGQISNIGHPNLLRTSSDYLLRAWL
ncbi:hypothetical protein D3C76_1601260 [compost metagenome]